MTKIKRTALRLLPVAIAFLVLAAVSNKAEARLFKSAATATATAKSANLGGDCYKPCISYKHHRGCKVCCGCESPIKTVLVVNDPCCCDCPVEVPVCIPSCCTDKPCVSSRCGLFGRGIVDYSWDCGYRVRVVFTRHGVVVHTYGS